MTASVTFIGMVTNTYTEVIHEADHYSEIRKRYLIKLFQYTSKREIVYKTNFHDICEFLPNLRN